MKKFPYRRVPIVRCDGAGKSTLAVKMGELFSLPVVHLDKLWLKTRTEPQFDELLSAELQKDNRIPRAIFSGRPSGGSLAPICAFFSTTTPTRAYQACTSAQKKTAA